LRKNAQLRAIKDLTRVRAARKHVPAGVGMVLLLATIGAAIFIALVAIWRPSLAMQGGGRVYGFVALFILPALAALGGLSAHVEHSKTTGFCLSCHVMEPYGQSLHIDDPQHLPALHWQNGNVPRDAACYACHTDYTLYGDLHAKLRGLRHVYVQYLGRIPARLHLYRPYNNRECLHCHAGTRPFLEASPHKDEPDTMTRIATSRLSCLTEGCHSITHDTGGLGKQKMWAAREESRR
jgi:cytochrome c-type protein NapC